MRFVLASMVVLLTACASTPPAADASSKPAPVVAPAAAPAEAKPAVEMAPTPYTADQIRNATPAGRHVVFKVEEPGKPVVKRVLDFPKADAAGTDIQTTTLDEAGHVLETKQSHATWEELRAHAAFPKSAVEIKHRTISITLGTVECSVYKVTGDGPDPEVTTFYFADAVPGPPVFFYVEKGGKRITTTTMEWNTVAN